VSAVAAKAASVSVEKSPSRVPRCGLRPDEPEARRHGREVDPRQREGDEHEAPGERVAQRQPGDRQPGHGAPPPSAPAFTRLHEDLLKRALQGHEREEPVARRDEVGGDVGGARRVVGGEQDLAALRRDHVTVAAEQRECSLVDAVEADAQLEAGPRQLVQPARVDHPAAVHDRHPVATSSTSLSRCELSRTATPSARRRRTRSRTSRRPMGSRALVGSSSRTRSGRPTSAWARPIRWVMPLE